MDSAFPGRGNPTNSRDFWTSARQKNSSLKQVGVALKSCDCHVTCHTYVCGRVRVERDDYKHKCNELERQLQEVLERNRVLTQQNEEIPILQDSVEEMKYMESKVVSRGKLPVQYS